MSLSKVSVACFKFEDLFSEGREYKLDVADDQGTTWRLSLNGWEDDDNVRGGVGIVPETKKIQGEGGKVFAFTPAIMFDAQVSLVVRNQSGDAVYEYNIPMSTYKASKEQGTTMIEFDLVKWSVLKEMLVEDDRGSPMSHLILDAVIQYQKKSLYVPKNPFGQNMLKLLDSEEDKDVFFNVEGQIISAHKLILKANSSVLATLCIGESSKESPIHIKDTKPDVFRHILNFLYGGNVPKVVYMVKHGKEIIDACDRYDVVGLKMATEVALVQKCGGDDTDTINVDNVADWIQYAHAKTCPLLKEHALSYFVARYKDVLKTDAYDKMKQCPTLMEEVMTAVYDTLKEDKRFGKSRNNSLLSVNQMRCKLNMMNLDVDGSKDTLAARLDAQKK